MTSARSNALTLGSRFALALAAPLALAACSSADGADGALAGDRIAPIEAPEGTSWLATHTVSEDGLGFILGNPDAPLKLTEYASHTCGACANFAVTGKPSLKEDYIAKGIVSFEQREVFLNPYDIIIALMTQCGSPERMQALSDDVWRNLPEVLNAAQANPAAVQAAGALPIEERFVQMGEATGLIDFFAARGLSSDQAKICLADTDKINTLVEGSSAKAQEVGVAGTPTFTLNGRKIDANQWPGVEPILQNAGAR